MRNINLFFILATFFCTTVFAGEFQDSFQTRTEINTLYKQGKYSELEEKYQQYRNDNSRTPSGIDKLGEEFYSSFLWDLREKNNLISPKSPIWHHHEQSLKKWGAQFPTSPAPRLLYAELLSMHAWAYRGEGYSDTVKIKNWTPFYEYISRATQSLRTVKQIAGQDPEWYNKALDVANSGGQFNISYEDLLTEATTKYPHYYPIYFTAARHYLPKWGGSIEKLEALANTAADNNKSDGDALYTRVYWVVEECDCDVYELSKKTFNNWDRIKKGFNDILAKYPSEWNIAHAAYFSCHAKDQPQTEQLFTRINSYVKQDWDWDSKKDGYRYYYCKAFAENKMDEYFQTLREDGGVGDPITKQKYHEYQDAYKAYVKKGNAPNYKYDPHAKDEYMKKNDEYNKAAHAAGFQ